MMFKDDKRTAATLIVKKMKEGDEVFKNRPESAGAELAESEDLYMVADEVLEAIKHGDVRALKEAMESFVECCMNKGPKEEMKEEQSEDHSEY